MSERTKRPLAACMACVLGLALLASLALRDGAFGGLDVRAAYRLRGFDDGLTGSLASAVAHLGDPLPEILFAAVACAVAIVRGRPRLTLAVLAVILGSNLTTQALKALLYHPRYQPLFGYYQVGPNSFPSGHATAVAAAACAFLLVLPRRWAPSVIVSGTLALVLVGCSVVALHRHYPSDVVGGLLVALAWFFATVAVCRALGVGDAARLAVGQGDIPDPDLLDRREDGVQGHS